MYTTLQRLAQTGHLAELLAAKNKKDTHFNSLNP